MARARWAERVLWSVLWLVVAVAPALAAPPRVVLDRDDAGAVDVALWATVEGVLEGAGFSLVSDATEREAIVAQVVLVADETGVWVTVLDIRDPTRTVRRRVARPEQESLYRETIAQVVLSVVEPLGAASTEAAPPQKVIAKLDSPRSDGDPEAQPTGRAVTFLLAARAGAGVLGPGALRPAFGGQLAARLLAATAPTFGLEVTGLVREQLREGGVSAQARATQLRAMAMLSTWSRARFACDAGLAVGLDLLSVRVDSVMPPLVASPASRRVQPVGSLRLSGRVRLSARTALVLGGAIDVDFALRRWVVERRGEQLALFRTPRLRPQATLALEWDFLALGGGTR